ncbi:MAG: hypothetical protein EOP88_21085 [Verrucomicrobiaceae bacterium]|nr:MAG: hypothetical protein EOP88_21085 [Verrucomicrobiaceae bacterium]
MKANRSIDLTVALAGLALGFFAAAGIAPAGAGAVEAVKRSSRVASAGAGETRKEKEAGRSSGEDSHSLSSLETRLRRHAPGPDYSFHMERLGDGELKTLSTALSKMFQAQPEIRTPAFRAIEDAARELYRREGLAGLEWARGLSPEEGQFTMFQQMLGAAVADSPAAAKPWVDIFRKEQGSQWSNPFLEAAIQSASGQGVDAILEVRKVFGEEIRTTPIICGPVPANFDFKRLLDEFGGEYGMHQPVHLWAANDPGAVWDALKGMKAGDGELSTRRFGSLFSGMTQTQGEEAATKWMVSRLDELPGDVREQAVFNLLATHDNRYQVVDTVMAGLPRDADRVMLATQMVTPFAGDAPLKILRNLGPGPMQVEALVGSAKVFSRAANDPANPLSKQVNEFYTKAVEDLDLPPADRQRVLETLRTPQDLFPK